MHVEAATECVLESRATDGAPWLRLCSAPCDIALPLAGRYRIVDANERSSNEFGIDEAAQERVVVRVKDGSGWATAGGVTLISVGSVAALAGMVTAAVSFSSELGGTGGAPNGGLLAAGLLVTALGVGGIVGGVALVQSGAHPAADVEPALPQVLPRTALRFVVPLVAVSF